MLVNPGSLSCVYFLFGLQGIMDIQSVISNAMLASFCGFRIYRSKVPIFILAEVFRADAFYYFSGSESYIAIYIYQNLP